MDITTQPPNTDTSSNSLGLSSGIFSADPSSPSLCSTLSEESIIRIENLTKVFKDRKRTVTAVNEITLNVNRGEIFGLLGPNGAGKSTLIRLLTTLLKPTSGTACVNNLNLSEYPEKIREIIGVCSQNSTLDLELTAYDNLEFYGKLEKVPSNALDARIWQLLEMTELTDRAHMRVQTLSGGMRRKLEIVRAFIHHPLILFLDEPTIGLDPEARREVWQQITKLNTENTTIILTTHYMDEAEKLCNRIAFVDKGQLIALDTLDNLKRLIPEGDLIEIGYDTLDNRIVPKIKSLNLINAVEEKEHKLVISATNGSRVLHDLVTIFDSFSVPMTTISIHSPSLEDIFIYLTGRKLDDSNTGEPPTSSGRR